MSPETLEQNREIWLTDVHKVSADWGDKPELRK